LKLRVRTYDGPLVLVNLVNHQLPNDQPGE
jgi:hypothetical protein